MQAVWREATTINTGSCLNAGKDDVAKFEIPYILGLYDNFGAVQEASLLDLPFPFSTNVAKPFSEAPLRCFFEALLIKKNYNDGFRAMWRQTTVPCRTEDDGGHQNKLRKMASRKAKVFRYGAIIQPTVWYNRKPHGKEERKPFFSTITATDWTRNASTKIW